jgi:hypothetical protein
MDIQSEHIASKKKIGILKGKPVVELVTTGGLHLIVTGKMGKMEALGAGPHRAVARYIAEKKEQDIQWTELSKADYMEPELFLDLIPKYETLTNRFRAMNGD